MSEKFSEEQLCAEFRADVAKLGFAVYPEVSDWDLVMVQLPGQMRYDGFYNAPDLDRIARPETQYGVQAKLAGNFKVLQQAASGRHQGPQVRGVLVNRASEDFIFVAQKLGLFVVVREELRRTFGMRKKVWTRPAQGWRIYPATRYWDTRRGLDLPSIACDLPAGTAAPKQLTKWREQALQLCKVLREQGYVTSADFKRFGLDMKYWTKNHLTDTGTKVHVIRTSKWLKKYVAREGGALPDVGWEQISEQLHKHLEKKAS